MTEGVVFDIQHFCVDDGPGIRTTVFLKGCPLRCAWCHNPEGLLPQPQLFYAASSCTSCQACASVCPGGCHQFVDGHHTVDFSSCTLCGACVDACPNEALRVSGRRMIPQDVLVEVLRDMPFFETSGGGVTLSGGEPLLQVDFACAIARGAKEKGLHVSVETSGHCAEEALCRISKYVDLFLFDFKLASSERHKKLTGVGNEKILNNLALLNSLGKPVILRCPIIPGCNDHEEHYLSIASLANQTPCVREIHLEPYHPFGVDKYASLGMKARYDWREIATSQCVKEAAEFIRSHTNTEVQIT